MYIHELAIEPLCSFLLQFSVVSPVWRIQGPAELSLLPVFASQQSYCKGFHTGHIPFTGVTLDVVFNSVPISLWATVSVLRWPERERFKEIALSHLTSSRSSHADCCICRLSTSPSAISSKCLKVCFVHQWCGLAAVRQAVCTIIG